MTKEKIYWKMRNGKLISVDDMTEEHAKNVLKIVLKNYSISFHDHDH